MSTATLIGIDWGTSSLRAYLFAADGNVLDTRRRPWGIRQLPEGGFAGALAELIRDWPDAPLLAAGMVGSRQGWREAPYVDLPADIDAVAATLCPVAVSPSRDLLIVPGVRDSASGDVMRGEETQVFGALAAHAGTDGIARLVLPGTHSKWVEVREGRLDAVATVMTGELHAVLLRHSILGAGVPETVGRDDDAFLRGVDVARDSGPAGVLSRLFSARTDVLDGRLDSSHVPDYLSGLLIGEELRMASTRGWADHHTPLSLVGEEALCRRYQLAARRFGWPMPTLIEHAAARGLWLIAQRAGLVSAGTATHGVS